MNLLDRYNDFYNDECSGLTHGGPISMQEMQALALECMVKAFKRKYNLDPIPADEILMLANQLAEQGQKSVVDLKNYKMLVEQLAEQGQKSVVNLKNYKEICEGLANE